MSEQIIIVGAGPAGVFTALTCKAAHPNAEITLLDRADEPLEVFKKSCRHPWRITRELYDPAELAGHYPRGSRELLGPFHHFGAADAMNWFEDHDIGLEIDDEGSVVPAKGIGFLRGRLLELLNASGVKFRGGMAIKGADAKSTGGFWLSLENEQTLQSDRLVLACGGLLATKVKGICESLGHTIIEPVPSIFDLHTKDTRILKANGGVVPKVKLIDDSGIEVCGTVSLEPWGLGGPAVGELTVRAAESMRDRRYQFKLRVDWLGGHKRPSEYDMPAIVREHPRRPVGEESHAPVPGRLWRQMLAEAKVDAETPWGRLSKQEAGALQSQLRHDTIKIVKRGAHKQEVVISGGVALNEVDFRSMQSHLVPGLYFAGEILDMDGLPGGANLQACWTTGYLAGQSLSGS